MIGLSSQRDIAGILRGSTAAEPRSAVRSGLPGDIHTSVANIGSAIIVVGIQTDFGGSRAVLIGDDRLARLTDDFHGQSFHGASLLILDMSSDGFHLTYCHMQPDRHIVDRVCHIAVLGNPVDFIHIVIRRKGLYVAAQFQIVTAIIVIALGLLY